MDKRFFLGALGGLLWLGGCQVRDEIARGRSNADTGSGIASAGTGSGGSVAAGAGSGGMGGAGDIDECAANPDNCGAHATCTNTVGSFTCTCNLGYIGDGMTCTLDTMLHVAAGSLHTCARLPDGRVKCWGANHNGLLGLGDTSDRGDKLDEMGDKLPTVLLGTGRIAAAISGGGDHMCAILGDGSVKCWGGNDFGELGLGDTLNRGDKPSEMGDNLPVVNLGTGRRAVAISAGQTHTCAILDDGSVKCWGFNLHGELGLGDTLNRGDGPNEMGGNLPAVNLGVGRRVVAISAGQTHTCAILDDGSVKCWGGNDFGELGLGDTLNRGDGPNEMGDNLPAVNLGTGRRAVAISAGTYHTCAVLIDKSLKCWGANWEGLLGLGDTLVRGDGPNEMGDNLPTVSLGAGRAAVAISAGAYHTCAIVDDGSVKCWGYNYQGRLGLGDTLARGDEPDEMGDNLPPVSLGTGETAAGIFVGHYHTCAVLNDGSLKCWGRNDYGQLGLGDTSCRGDEPNEMGDNLPAVKLW